MNIYVFDENDKYFMEPRVPFAAPGTVNLRIKVAVSKADMVRVFLYPDGGEAAVTEMRFDRVEGSYDIFKCELQIEKPGLYWCHFLINTTPFFRTENCP